MPTDNRRQQVRKRKIDETELASDPAIAEVLAKAKRGAVDEAVAIATAAIQKASTDGQGGKRKHRPWFDEECEARKLSCINAQPGSEMYRLARRD